MQHRKLALAVFAAAFASGSAAAATLDTFVNAGFDQDSRAPTAVSVAAPADYQNPREVKAFYNRLKGAAVAACNSNIPAADARRADDACARKALADAVATVARPVVTALHQSDNRIGYASGY